MPSISSRANTPPKRQTYVPRHKQLLLNPALSLQRSLHVDQAEEAAPNAGGAGPRPPIKKLAIGQPILSFSSNPDAKLTITPNAVPVRREVNTGASASPAAASASSSEAAVAHVVDDSSPATTTARRASIVQVKRKAVPVYDAFEFPVSISSSTSASTLSTEAGSAPRRRDDDFANLVSALDQVSISAATWAQPSPMDRRTLRDNHGLGLDWASSQLLKNPEAMPRTRASSTSSSQRHSLENPSPPLLPFSAQSTPAPKHSSVYSQAYQQTHGASERVAHSGLPHHPNTCTASSEPVMDFVLGPDVRGQDDSPDARLQAWRKGMHDVEAERANNQSRRHSKKEKQTSSSCEFLACRHGSEVRLAMLTQLFGSPARFLFRRPSVSSGSRASSRAGFSSSSHDSQSTNAFSPTDSSFPALPSKGDLNRRCSVASSATSSRPFALVSGRSGSMASSRDRGLPSRRASLLFGVDDTRRQSSIASKTRPTGIVGGDDSLLDIWVEMMGGEVEDGSDDLAQLPFPSRKRGSAASDVFGRPPVSSRKPSLAPREPIYGAEAIIPLYHALPPLVYASSGRHRSHSQSSSAPTLSSDDGLDSESDASDDWRSACSQPSACDPAIAPSGVTGSANPTELTSFAWPTAKVNPRATFDLPEPILSYSPHLSLAPETAHATPTLSSTKIFFISNGPYHTSRLQDVADLRESLAFESHHPTVHRTAIPFAASSPGSRCLQRPFIAVA
ncbi:BQ2448_7249 [Microbotryum intermedium]|uniref:BQ2448_7249 protein n=1 Tax=Microbotryum intermedium TaxID=269621 RepID=A0A238FMT5_9BASI|nr:BQ2448_7249 [Microbotryum intermedium]